MKPNQWPLTSELKLFNLFWNIFYIISFYDRNIFTSYTRDRDYVLIYFSAVSHNALFFLRHRHNNELSKDMVVINEGNCLRLSYYCQQKSGSTLHFLAVLLLRNRVIFSKTRIVRNYYQEMFRLCSGFAHVQVKLLIFLTRYTRRH